MVGVLFGYGWLNCVVRVQSVTGVGVLISPSVPVSGTGTGFDPPPSRERLVLSCSLVSPCGYCLEASMTDPAAPSFPRRRESKSCKSSIILQILILTDRGATRPPLWIADQVRNDVTLCVACHLPSAIAAILNVTHRFAQTRKVLINLYEIYNHETEM